MGSNPWLPAEAELDMPRRKSPASLQPALDLACLKAVQAWDFSEEIADAVQGVALP